MSMIASLARFAPDFLKPPKPATESVIPNGIFTLTLPDGGHRTFRIWTKTATSKFAPRQRVIGILVGPDNTMEYEPWGWVGEDGIRPWRGRMGAFGKFAEVLWRVLARGEDAIMADDGWEVLAERKCIVCNRPLTTPESIEAGIGPECAERWKG